MACAGCLYENAVNLGIEQVVVVAKERLYRADLRSCVTQVLPSAAVTDFETGGAALEKLRFGRVDLVVSDTQTEDMDGLDYIQEVVSRRYATYQVVLSRRFDERLLTFLARLKVNVWLDGQDIDHHELCCGICRACSGQRYVSRRLAQACADRGAFIVECRLSPLEQLVFSVLAEGSDDNEAAGRLHATVGTVRAHRERIMRKLDLHHRTHLRALAIRTGYLRSVDARVLHPGFEHVLQGIAVYGRRTRQATAARPETSR